MSLTQFNCTTSVAGGQKVTTAVSGGISLNEGIIQKLYGERFQRPTLFLVKNKELDFWDKKKISF
jgi:hypothetical protein